MRSVGILLCSQTYVARLLRVGPIKKKSYRICARSMGGFCARSVTLKKIVYAQIMISRVCACVCVISFGILKGGATKMITHRYYKLFMLNKFATGPTLNNCLAKINISGSFLNRPRISARYKYLVRNFDFAEPCVLVGKPVQYELFPIPQALLFRFEKGRKKGKTVSKIY